jgi:hypothetical protein
MSKGEHDIVVFIINFLGFNKQPKSITIGLFKGIKNTRQTLANNLTKLFDQCGLRNKIIAYVKDEGSHFNTMTIALKFVMKCEVLGFNENFQGIFLAMLFLKHVHVLLLTKNCKNVQLGVKNLGSANMNGIMFVLILIFH